MAHLQSDFSHDISQYIVNDIYKRFINPNASNQKQVRLSILASLVIVLVGILFGFLAESITKITLLIVGGLYGGYVAANVLKWHWWRFNAYGFFWGMLVGTLSALAVPWVVEKLWPGTNTLYAFPPILILSVIGCLAGTLLTPPEDSAILKQFYRTVRPWGCWGPILDQIQQEDPDFKPNRDMPRDLFNVVVGAAWQIALAALPLYIIIRHRMGIVWGAVGVIVTTVILKKNWYDRLPED